ncbi:hypothetical protein ES705_40474 [subsurface metagenome]
MKQKIKTIIIPEAGFDLVPPHVTESEVDTDFIRALAHIIAQSPSGSVALRCTTDGRLHVAVAGVSYEIYVVENGNAPDAYDVGSTYESANAQYVTDFLIETFGATISFRNAAGVWGGGKALPVGFHSIEFINYGVRIQNRVGASVCEYEITTYR